jgi:hypothetical protein
MNDEQFLDLSALLRMASPAGLVMEFGVATGASVWLIADEVWPRKVYGFDSFLGLPEDWVCPDGTVAHARGAFACDVPTYLPRNVELVVGLFQDNAARVPGVA